MSMTARGYGLKNRKTYSVFRFRRQDVCGLAAGMILTALIIAGIASEAVAFSFYPAIKYPSFNITGIITYVCFAVFVLLPSAVEIKEALLWKYLKSKI